MANELIDMLKEAHLVEMKGRSMGCRHFITWVLAKLSINPKTIVEIGVFAGALSRWFGGHFRNATLYGVDPYDLFPNTESGGAAFRYYKTPAAKAREAAHRFYDKSESYILVEKKAADAVGDIPDDIDLVFIDGDHSYEAVMDDIHIYGPKVRPGGVIIGHDYNKCGGVRLAVIDSFGDDHLRGGYNKGNCWVKPIEL